MKILILNPKKLIQKNKYTNYFLGKWFLNFIEKKKLKKIKFDFQNDLKTNLKKEEEKIKKIKSIYKKIFSEIFPLLNQIHNINWKKSTWEFILGRWLFFYIAIILDRIDLIKNLKKKGELKISHLVKLGEITHLSSYHIRDFTFRAGLTNWNEKLISRILYLITKKKFNNIKNLTAAEKFHFTKNDLSNVGIIYKFKIYLLKFFERILCFNNKVLLYNTYVSNKIDLIKIHLGLKNFPFKYDYNFFNAKIIEKGINKVLRNKLSLNLNIKQLDIKIIKFLITETLPTVYLEGFNDLKTLSENSHLPKKGNRIFTSSAHFDSPFKFWLAEKINSGAKIYYGQHGADYNIRRFGFTDIFETKIAVKNFCWGKNKNSKKKISIGNFLLKSNKIKPVNNKKILIVLPACDIYKRTVLMGQNINDFDNAKKEINKLIHYINQKKYNAINIRPHPQNFRRELNFEKFLNLKKGINVINYDEYFNETVNKHEIVIFTYLSTEFFKLLAQNKPCCLLINKKLLNIYFTNSSKHKFKKLIEGNILFTDGKKLAYHINQISENIYRWWEEEENKLIKTEFCINFSNPFFNVKKLIKNLVF